MPSSSVCNFLTRDKWLFFFFFWASHSIPIHLLYLFTCERTHSHHKSHTHNPPRTRIDLQLHYHWISQNPWDMLRGINWNLFETKSSCDTRVDPEDRTCMGLAGSFASDKWLTGSKALAHYLFSQITIVYSFLLLGIITVVDWDALEVLRDQFWRDVDNGFMCLHETQHPCKKCSTSYWKKVSRDGGMER